MRGMREFIDRITQSLIGRSIEERHSFFELTFVVLLLSSCDDQLQKGTSKATENIMDAT